MHFPSAGRTPRRCPIGSLNWLRLDGNRDPDLGHMPGRLRLGDEVDVITRILESGGTGYWVPQAKVEHCIGRERQTVRYLVRYFATQGETMEFLSELKKPSVSDRPKSPRLLFGVPRWRWRAFLEQWLRFRLHRFFAPASI